MMLMYSLINFVKYISDSLGWLRCLRLSGHGICGWIWLEATGHDRGGEMLPEERRIVQPSNASYVST